MSDSSLEKSAIRMGHSALVMSKVALDQIIKY